MRVTISPYPSLLLANKTILFFHLSHLSEWDTIFWGLDLYFPYD
jgi:hypothetical protein